MSSSPFSFVILIVIFLLHIDVFFINFRIWHFPILTNVWVYVLIIFFIPIRWTWVIFLMRRGYFIWVRWIWWYVRVVFWIIWDQMVFIIDDDVSVLIFSCLGWDVFYYVMKGSTCHRRGFISLFILLVVQIKKRS